MLCSLPAISGVWYVDRDNLSGTEDGLSWATAFQTIQPALDLAARDDEIWVAEGIYDETRPSPNGSLMITQRRVYLYGGFAGTETERNQRDWAVRTTIIDGSNGRGPGIPAYHVIEGNNRATLDGFSITGGRADGEESLGYGGGMYNHGGGVSVANCRFYGNYGLLGGAMHNCLGASAIVENTVFFNNQASEMGGGIYNKAASHRLTNCTFLYNTARDGGGVYNEGGGPRLISCYLGFNNATGSGGGVYNNGAGPTITSTTFESNTAGMDGGGIYTTGGILVAANCTWQANTAQNAGGGAYNSAGTQSFSACRFTANASSVKGGGIYNGGNCAPSLVNCLFSGNISGTAGGAAYNEGGGIQSFTNCTVYGNTADTCGGIFTRTGSTGAIVNCILWNDGNGEIAVDNGGIATADYSDIQGGWPGQGNLDADPALRNPAAGDFRLRAVSPCIDAGTAANAPLTDLAGVVRPQGSEFDMGAYEYVGPRISIVGPSIPITNIGPVEFVLIYTDATSISLIPDDVVLNIEGTASGTIGISGSGAVQRIVTISGISGDGALGISIAAGTALDADGNEAPNAGPSDTVTIDNTPPTVLLQTTASDPTGTTPIPVTALFSESVLGFDASDVGVSNAIVGDFVGAGDSYSFNLYPMSNGPVTATVEAGAATDTAGNPNTPGSLGITFESPSPTVVLATIAPNPTNAAPIPVTATFSESVMDFDATDIVVDNASVDHFTGMDAAYSFDLIPSGGTVVIAVSIPAGVAFNSLGSPNSASAPLIRTYDADPPVVLSVQTTGAMLPEGADCVIMIEYTEQVRENVVRFNGASTRDNICRKSEDIREGDAVLLHGSRIAAQHVAVLATVGCTYPRVYRKARVGIIATGDELVEPTEYPGPSQIRTSNSHQLYAQALTADTLPTYYGIARDTKPAIDSALKRAIAENDVILLSGGVSKGDFDLVPDIMTENGVEILFDSIAIKPGKPTTFGVSPDIYCFGLPGNPVSTFIQFEILVKPFLYKIMGYDFHPFHSMLPLASPIKTKGTDRETWLPVKLTPDGRVEAGAYHGSAHINALCDADGLIVLPIGTTVMQEGTLVRVRPIQ